MYPEAHLRAFSLSKSGYTNKIALQCAVVDIREQLRRWGWIPFKDMLSWVCSHLQLHGESWCEVMSWLTYLHCKKKKRNHIRSCYIQDFNSPQGQWSLTLAHTAVWAEDNIKKFLWWIARHSYLGFTLTSAKNMLPVTKLEVVCACCVSKTCPSSVSLCGPEELDHTHC